MLVSLPAEVYAICNVPSIVGYIMTELGDSITTSEKGFCALLCSFLYNIECYVYLFCRILICCCFYGYARGRVTYWVYFRSIWKKIRPVACIRHQFYCRYCKHFFQIRKAFKYFMLRTRVGVCIFAICRFSHRLSHYWRHR